VGQTSQEQREEFVKKYYEDIKHSEDAILLILEQADRFEKTTLIGKIFKACILGEITYEDALKLSEMVNKTLWGDLEKIIKGEKIDLSEKNGTLIQAGFVIMSFEKFTFATCNPSDDGSMLQRVTYKPSLYYYQLRKIAKL